MKRMVLLLLLLLLMGLSLPALADDVMQVSVPVSGTVTSDCSYLRLTCQLNGEQAVMVTVADASGNLHYQRSYGLCSGSFCSEELYLKLSGAQTVYQVTLQAGDTVYSFPVKRVMPRLKNNEACSVGYPLSRLAGSSSWKSVTLLDVRAMEGDSLTVPLHASGAYTLGTVTFKVSGGKLKVTAALDSAIDGSIDKSTIYVATDALAAQKLGTSRFDGRKGKLNESIDLGDTPYAAVLVVLTVSFDPSGVPGSPRTELNGQEALWQLMQTHTANEAVG